jgi:hypothetical protein
MNIIELNSFERAILYEFQRRHVTLLNFQQLWNVCAATGPNLPEPISSQADKNRFVAQLMAACEHLSDVGAARLFRSPNGHVQFIRLTEAGVHTIENIIFSHTNRVPLEYTKPREITWSKSAPPGAKR